jgi:GTPase SAR1 family protein
MIGLVGAKNSGKTVLMTVLVKRLRDTVGKRYQADIRLATDNPDGHQGVSDYQANRETPLFKGGTLPPPTSALGTSARQHSSPVLLRWRQETPGLMGRTSIKSTMLSFVDAAGEDLNAVATAFTLQYLSVCGGLIVVLDPFALPGARAMLNLPDAAIQVEEDVPLDVVANITEMLRVEHNLKKKQKIAIPIAVVFTKIDAFFPTLDRGNPLMTTAPAVPAYDNADGQAVHENMLALMHQWNAQDVDTHVRLNYADYRYFGVSALGAEPDYENFTVAAGGVRPHRVEDPVLWLLSKTRTVRSA